MSAIPLAHFLPEFDAEGTVPAPVRQARRVAGREQPVFERLFLVQDKREGAATREEPAPARKPIVPSPESEAQREAKAAEALRAAREAAYHDGRSSMEAEMQLAVTESIRQERARAEAERAAATAAARAEWVSKESARLAGLFESGLEMLESAVRETVSGVLKSAAMEARTRRTIDELAEAVGPMTLDGRALQIQVKGPPDLLDAFAARLGERSALVTFQPDASMGDISIKADKTLIDTRLIAWRRMLDEALS